MTREEARKIVFDKCKNLNLKGSECEGLLNALSECEALVDALEALGLIKFEEEKPEYITIEHCGGVGKNTCTVAIADAVEALRRVGILTIRPE